MEENPYNKEYKQYLEYALNRFLVDVHGLSEYEANLKVLQDFESVLKKAKIEGYL